MDVTKYKVFLSVLTLLFCLVLLGCKKAEQTDDIKLDIYYKNVYSVNNLGYDLSVEDLAAKFGINDLTEASTRIVDTEDKVLLITEYEPVKFNCLNRECEIIFETQNEVVSRVVLRFDFDLGLFDEIKEAISKDNGEALINDFNGTDIAIWKKGKTSLSLSKSTDSVLLEFVNPQTN